MECGYARNPAEVTNLPLGRSLEDGGKDSSSSVYLTAIGDMECDYARNPAEVSNLPLGRSLEDSGKDFSSSVRDRLTKEYKETGGVGGLEVCAHTSMLGRVAC